MTIRTRIVLGVSAAALSFSLALAPAAFAQDKMGKDDGMKKDTMSKDSMKKKDTMSKDMMKKDDGMMKKNCRRGELRAPCRQSNRAQYHSGMDAPAPCPESRKSEARYRW